MGRTRIKICGVRDVTTALAASESGADALGFVFVRSSPRFIEPESAWEIASVLPPFVTRVGLFADASADAFYEIKERCPLDYAQLHGNESVPVVRECGPWIIKAVRWDPASIESEFTRWSRVEEVDAVLVDSGPGGTGETLDWDALAGASGACAHPLILAGGLTPENVGEAIRKVRPFAVDVSSGVERERGVKDPALIAAFCRAVREADAAPAG